MVKTIIEIEGSSAPNQWAKFVGGDNAYIVISGQAFSEVHMTEKILKVTVVED